MLNGISNKKTLLIIFLIITVLAGAYLRLVGVNWDDNHHMHPDERFLSMVQASISPVENVSDYFDTATSSLNPANRGHTFFVYGTLPIFIVRYLGEALGQTDYDSITILGRQVSALFDLLTIVLVFAIGKRLYNRWAGLLGAVFYALAVLPIQLSHYMTVDVPTNTFAYLAVFGAVWALTRPDGKVVKKMDDTEEPAADQDSVDENQPSQSSFNLIKLGQLLRELAPYILFGVALGAATASKINAVVLAMVLPLVEGMRILDIEPDERQAAFPRVLRNLLVAGILSFLVFRIGQPYAFDGPGFLNMRINENWWSGLQSLRSQTSGAVDFPPALQWARRPITFSWENMVVWGFGWPLGLLAWAAFFAMGWLILRKHDLRRHFPLWVFTGLHFVWQALAFTRSMRYQMLIYPALALIAGWGLVELWSISKAVNIGRVKISPKAIRTAGIVLTALVVTLTAAWAFAFSRIYTRPHTRVAASRWIFQNISGPLTLELETADGNYQQPLSYPVGDTLVAGEPFRMPFLAIADSKLQSVTFPHILDQTQKMTIKQIMLSVVSADGAEKVLASTLIESDFLPPDNNRWGDSFAFEFTRSVAVQKGELYYLQLELLQGGSSILLRGSPVANLLTHEGMELDSPLPQIQQSISTETPYSYTTRLVEGGTIRAVHIPYIIERSGLEGTKALTLTIEGPDQEIRVNTLYSEFTTDTDIRGDAYTFSLEQPLVVQSGETIHFSLTTSTAGARIVLYTLAPVHESSWDDVVPYRVDGYNAYREDGGIYRGDLNFQMYWPDDENKLNRFETNLDLADYIFISSNRQWGTTTRVPERYPLTTHYYRQLMGCPADETIIWCYSVAEPGMFDGTLGFELVAISHSNPNLGPIEFNTQFAEEAFTVYDHPKVLIFQKTEAYDPIEVRHILRSVDLSKVVYFTPAEAASYRGTVAEQVLEPRHNLILPPDRLEGQRLGGTWSELFNTHSLLNRSEPLAIVAFYLFVSLLGVISYPLVRLALPGLNDRGYPLSKLAGLLLLAFFVWIPGSLGVAVTKTSILVVLIGITLIAVSLILLQRKRLWQELKDNWRYFLMIEVLAIIAFGLFLLVRLGNPDLWHPFKGGEKPMDFSYLNAVIKSTSFPPYDPWFSNGFINYYYYGFVIVGMPIKLLGIVPAIAYNLVLPMWYSLLSLGAFSVGWNLYKGIPRTIALKIGEEKTKKILGTAFWVGLTTAIGMVVLGNLGTIRLITTGFQRLAAAGASIDEASLGQQISWTLQGLGQFIQGAPMPFYPGDWYWVPSRVIPGEPITEFPYFTFLYADLHAHLIAFPITVFGISWSLSVVLNRGRWGEKDGKNKLLSGAISYTLGAIVIGALLPTNTWDFYTYLVLGMIALFYSIVRHYSPRLNIKGRWGVLLEKIGIASLASITLALLARLFYHPFTYWFGQAYAQVDIWQGDRTPLNSYFTHWGLFLFIIFSWLCWETYYWMKTTPQSALKKLEPYRSVIYSVLLIFFILLVICLLMGVVVALVVLPLGLWIVALMFRPGMSNGYRFLLFLMGTALMVTLAVELFFLPGDIGRMNSVFKFYLQAWIMFALVSGLCLAWVIKSLRYWRNKLAVFWQFGLFILVVSAALFTVTGTADKIRDRMAPEAPRSLDGMAYMTHAVYRDQGEEMQLEEDYHAIRWMQENIEGSPVILEGQANEYRWGNRFTIYTGLPGVVGWNWHQRQQRAVLQRNVVQERVDAVNEFYTTEDIDYVSDFITRYDVAYIVFGQLERFYYPGPGLDKFHDYESQLWEEVYRYHSTIIYQVLD